VAIQTCDFPITKLLEVLFVVFVYAAVFTCVLWRKNIQVTEGF